MDYFYDIRSAEEDAKKEDAKREDADKLFDELAEEILNVSNRIVLTAPPADTSHATFTLSETVVTRNAGSDSISEEVITCPKARLLGSTIPKPKDLKCRCCCVGEPHADNLTYKRK
ncbi:hypothetical protein FNYG_08759 [Fusarium nygamai]|uniref:Uncharacterized protein n=1 Tax=Gibberella nygamai TaxID=42673 RepID=A0A2K0W6X8_GIBNY|nr:hypothetical protein FNYG_08759 [Fusarium nygamai]